MDRSTFTTRWSIFNVSSLPFLSIGLSILHLKLGEAIANISRKGCLLLGFIQEFMHSLEWAVETRAGYIITQP